MKLILIYFHNYHNIDGINQMKWKGSNILGKITNHPHPTELIIQFRLVRL